jgi:hypothetical protein
MRPILRLNARKIITEKDTSSFNVSVLHTFRQKLPWAKQPERKPIIIVETEITTVQVSNKEKTLSEFDTQCQIVQGCDSSVALEVLSWIKIISASFPSASQYRYRGMKTKKISEIAGSCQRPLIHRTENQHCETRRLKGAEWCLISSCSNSVKLGSSPKLLIIDNQPCALAPFRRIIYFCVLICQTNVILTAPKKKVLYVNPITCRTWKVLGNFCTYNWSTSKAELGLGFYLLC